MVIQIDATKEAMAMAYAGHALFASLHTADPGENGDNEIPGLARQPVTWSDNGAGEVLSGEITFTLADETAVTHIGVWDAGDVFWDYFEADADLPAGDYTVILSYTQE